MHCVNISLKGFKIDPVIQFAEFKVESFFWLQKKLLVYGRLDHILKVYMFFMGHLLFTIPVALACIIKADLDPFHESCQQCSIITEAPPNQTKFLEIREK